MKREPAAGLGGGTEERRGLRLGCGTMNRYTRRSVGTDGVEARGSVFVRETTMDPWVDELEWARFLLKFRRPANRGRMVTRKTQVNVRTGPFSFEEHTAEREREKYSLGKRGEDPHGQGSVFFRRISLGRTCNHPGKRFTLVPFGG